MQSNFTETLAHLLIYQDQASVEFSTEFFALGSQWVRTCVEVGDATEAWFAQVKDGNDAEWVVGWPSDSKLPSFSTKKVDEVLQLKKATFFQDDNNIASGCIFPLQNDGKIIGLLGLLSDQADFFAPTVLSWIKTFVEMATYSISQLDSLTSKYQAKNLISHILQSDSNPKDTLQSVLEVLVNLLKAKTAIVLKYNPGKHQFNLLATYGFEARSLAKVYFYIQNGLAKQFVEDYRIIFKENKSFLETNNKDVNFFASEGLNYHTALPLMRHVDMIGAIEIFWNEISEIDAWASEILQFSAESIASLIERHAVIDDLKHHNEELASTVTAIIEGLSRALELRDLETEGHTRRVSALVVHLAKRMQVSVDQQAAIRQGALLHDIGKLGIPDAILLKPGSLTPQEWKIMQQHPMYAFKIMAPITGLKKALEIPLYHHERWDGNGYPYGLKEKQIPLSARMFAVVDVYDALTSDRPYRAAWPKSQALGYIREQAGLQFDPGTVEEFLSLINEMK